jgi:hypothetical protein
VTPRLIAAFALLLVAGGCGLASAQGSWQMVDEVNGRLPEDQRFDPLGWHAGKYLSLWSAYGRLCPAGRLGRRVRYFSLAGVACVIVAAWLIGLFG